MFFCGVNLLSSSSCPANRVYICKQNVELFDVLVKMWLVLISRVQQQLEVEPCVKDQGENSFALQMRDSLQLHREPLQTACNYCL